MINRFARLAQATSSARRSGAMTAPVGNWWAGVTTMAAAVSAVERIGPHAVGIDRNAFDPQTDGRGVSQPDRGDGDSKAIVVAPRASSTRDTRSRPWVKPWVMAMRSGSMRTPRTRRGTR